MATVTHPPLKSAIERHAKATRVYDVDAFIRGELHLIRTTAYSLTEIANSPFCRHDWIVVKTVRN